MRQNRWLTTFIVDGYRILYRFTGRNTQQTLIKSVGPPSLRNVVYTLTLNTLIGKIIHFSRARGHG